MRETSRVREAAVAGLFYPHDPAALAHTVDQLLADAGAHDVSPCVSPRMLISPHAGYAYSGAIAARAFAPIDRSRIDTVVVIGPSHVDAFSFTSVFDGSAYSTPLGRLHVDEALAEAISDTAASIRRSDRGHVTRGRRGEHGIEVTLPFLQRMFVSPRVVPIVMGSQGWDASRDLGAAMAAAIDPQRTLLVASCDLSHFYSYDEAIRRDAAFCDAFATLDTRRLHDAVRNGLCDACGIGPVVAALIATEGHAFRTSCILARGNSGDVGGDRDSVVGYVAAHVSTISGAYATR